MKTQNVWFITGASRGFGLEIARAALAAGDQVVATVRSQPAQVTNALHNDPNLYVVQMDVTQEDQVKVAVQQGIARFGRIDVLVNNAGYGMVTAIEEATDAEVRQQYDTNVFGLLSVTRAVLPYLRQQKSGRIINISSLFGYDAIPGWGLYGSTKFAVEGLSKGLAVELAPLGIHVTVVAPGLFSTDFLSTESYIAAKTIIDDYQETVGQMRSGADALHGNQPGDPKKFAQVILQVATTDHPPVHLPVGKDAIAMYQNNAVKVAQEIEAWLPVTTSTDHDQRITASTVV
ncbi:MULTISPECIES: oxidoreductase [unclassified Leptolyngbya]|uniref:oxidoreductase n=1 Tax=unclassified Leptolyngbya TaxID=2650499 RepID=UPI001686AC54|nr:MULTISPECIES: oxidoreductase [unclassified Leptolyngbya]MBD1909352.1 SDR family NAD(P)-dependent oxidoreductase [Leptolyngbya sp. FACHB-8]MBD2156937.1 SDR family NAD(P)-dependent oxidoreductase [Leptolyngbya sp. FACHB-16]